MTEKAKKQESVVNITNTLDDTEPAAILPDSEIKEAIIRVCKDDDVKEVLHKAIKKYERQQEKWHDKNIVKFFLYPLIIVTISILLSTLVH